MATNKRFTVEQQDEICQAYLSGESPESICQAWGVGNGTLYRILHRHNIPLRINERRTPNITMQVNNGAFVDPFGLPPPGLDVIDTGKNRYRVGFYVRRTIHADSAEAAIYKAAGYEGFQELVYLRKEV